MNVIILQEHKHRQLEQQQEQEQAFLEYAALARKAQATVNLSDAIAAGKAWARFLALFCDGAQQ